MDVGKRFRIHPCSKKVGHLNLLVPPLSLNLLSLRVWLLNSGLHKRSDESLLSRAGQGQVLPTYLLELLAFLGLHLASLSSHFFLSFLRLL